MRARLETSSDLLRKNERDDKEATTKHTKSTKKTFIKGDSSCTRSPGATEEGISGCPHRARFRRSLPVAHRNDPQCAMHRQAREHCNSAAFSDVSYTARSRMR